VNQGQVHEDDPSSGGDLEANVAGMNALPGQPQRESDVILPASTRIPLPAGHSAAGAMSGFLYQAQWALVVLLRAGRDNPSVAIRIEHLDDIEIVAGLDGQTLIQVKSSIQERPPNVINSSRDLWSTLRVWADYVRTTPSPGYPERFVLVTTAECAPGSAPAALRFGRASDHAAALAVLNEIAETNDGSTNASDYQVWRSLSPAQRSRIIAATTIIDGSQPINEVSDIIARELFPSMRGDIGVARMRDGVLGWWMGRIARHIRNRSSDQITYEEVQHAARIRTDDLSADALPLDDAVVAYAHELEKADEFKVFVKQLRIIGCRNGRVVQAIIDYYRSRSHIDNWLRLDLFPPEKLRLYFTDLHDRWRRRRANILDDLPDACEDVQLQTAGRQLLDATLTQQFPITPERSEEWIMTGAYHQLADEKRVGWHRDYDGRIS
jgi:hypothetical protein